MRAAAFPAPRHSVLGTAVEPCKLAQCRQQLIVKRRELQTAKIEFFRLVVWHAAMRRSASSLPSFPSPSVSVDVRHIGGKQPAASNLVILAQLAFGQWHYLFDKAEKLIKTMIVQKLR